jgi:two-component system, LytTR family, response regulator LytT
MTPCKILIVEDESLVAMDMVDMLQKIGYETLPTAMGFNDAIALLETEKPDLVLVDITLGGTKTGIDLATLLHTQYKIPFIFISSHSDKITVDLAAATQPCSYLIKPFDSDDLYTSIEVALSTYRGRKREMTAASTDLQVTESIFIKTDKSYTKVRIADILWLESEHNYIFIVTEKTKYIVRSSFKEFLVNFPPALFIQIHKSYIVNSTVIDSFSHTEVIINGKEIPLSRMYKDELFARMNKVQ